MPSIYADPAYTPKKLDDMIYSFYCRNSVLSAKIKSICLSVVPPCTRADLVSTDQTAQASEVLTELKTVLPLTSLVRQYSVQYRRTNPEQWQDKTREVRLAHSEVLANKAMILKMEGEKARRMKEGIWSGPHYWPQNQQ